MVFVERPEFWRACRFIQIRNNDVSRFGVSHGFLATKPWLTPKRLIKRQPLANPATVKLRLDGPLVNSLLLCKRSSIAVLFIAYRPSGVPLMVMRRVPMAPNPKIELRQDAIA